jgi:hypothetical protein
MRCDQCEQEGRHHPWCLNKPEGETDSLVDFLDEQVDVPWALDPPWWLLAECAAIPNGELPELQMRSDEIDGGGAQGLQLLATVAAGIHVELPEDVMFEPMDLVNGTELRCEEDNSELSAIELDKDTFERSRSPGELLGRIGPNSPVENENSEESQPDVLENLMQSARKLAQDLSAYVGPIEQIENCDGQKVALVKPQMKRVASSSEGRCMDCTAYGPCMRDICTVAPDVVVEEPPQSPEPDSDRECWSDSSDTYQPMVSPVSPAESPFGVAPGAGTSGMMDRELGPSKAQQYWSKKVRQEGGIGKAKRVAMIRPRMRWIRPVAIQALQDPRRFRVTTQAPILQTRAIITRTIGTDGSVFERALHDQFVMAHSVATQTLTPEQDEVISAITNRSMATQTLPQVEAVEDAEGSRSVATQTNGPLMRDAQTSMEDDVWEIFSDQEVSSEDECSSQEDMSCDSSSDDEIDMNENISSVGTPVQDENDV